MPPSENTPKKDDFHLERSRFLDAFADLEEVMAVKPLPPQDKQLAELLKALKSVRNDLVHSHLRFGPLDGKLHAIAINTQQSGKTARAARVVAIEDFKDLSSKIGQLKKAVG